MNELLGFAEKMLNEYGEFHPFGGYLKNSGAMVQVGAESGSAQEKVGHLVASFRRLASERKGKVFGVATNVTLPFDDGKKGNAIKVFLEHREGYCAEVFFRYDLSDGAKITDTTAQQGEPVIFPSKH